MGAFYGSVQVRSDDHDAVKLAAEQVARELGVRALVGPAINGWVGIYPEMNGQNEGVGAALARRVDGDVLHLIVHDDDIFAYWLYRGGALVDSFWSLPGYFGDENLAAEQAMAGNPEAFRPLQGDRAGELAQVLRRGDEQDLFASDQMSAFADLLGIANALTAYEYLKDGETEGVEQWKEFKEVPEERAAGDRQIARDRRRVVETARKQLKAEGLLLLHDERKGGMPYGCAIGQGFGVAWADHRAGTVSFATYEPKWASARPLELDTSKHVTGLANDRGGARVAMSAGDRVHVWDVADGAWTRVCDIPESDLAIAVAISADGKLVAHASRHEVVVTEIEGNRRLCAVPFPTARRLAFHPDGEWLAVVGQEFGLVSIGSQPHWRQLYAGGKQQVAPVVFKSLQGVDLDEMERMYRVQMEKEIKKMQQPTGPGKQPAMSEEATLQFRDQMEKSILEMRSKLAELQYGSGLAPALTAKETMTSAAFTRDGQWLFCGTLGGLHAYRWDCVPREAGSDLLDPAWTYEMPRRDPLGQPRDRIWAIAEERDASAVIFAGSEGIFRRLDFESGKVQELLKLPGECWIVDLAMSADGATLGAHVQTMGYTNAARNRHEHTPAWEVWSCERLRDLR